jgi:hypothetical protein
MSNPIYSLLHCIYRNTDLHREVFLYGFLNLFSLIVFSPMDFFFLVLWNWNWNLNRSTIVAIALSLLWIVVNLRTRRYMDLTTNNNHCCSCYVRPNRELLSSALPPRYR